MHLTIVNSYKDLQTVQEQTCWDDFVTLMRGFSTEPRTIDDKLEGRVPAIINAIYKPDASNKSVDQTQSGTDWMAFDVDDLDIESLARIRATIQTWGVNYLLWSTTKHTPAAPRIRLVFKLDRIITGEEHAKLWRLFNFQLEHRVDINTRNLNRLHYVPALWTSSSGHLFEDHRGNVEAFDADAMLAAVDDLIAQGAITLPDQADSVDVAELLAGLTNTGLDWSGATDCPFITQDMAEDFRTSPKGGRFYRLMTRIAVRAINARYPISASELEALALEVDRTTGSKGRTRTLAEAQRALEWAQNTYVVSPSNASALLETYDTGLTFEYVDAGCGEGKTTRLLSDVLSTGGVWVWSTPKITDMNKRIEEMRRLSPSRFAVFNIHTAFFHGAGEQDDETLSVVDQLGRVRAAITRKTNEPHIVFVTHAANKLMDWGAWADLNPLMVEDEVRDVLMTRELDYRKNFDVVRPLFNVVEEESGCYRLGPSKQAEQDLAEDRFDDLDRKLKYILRLLASSNNEVWVTRESWDAQGSKPFELVIINKPHNLRAFKRVIFLGDDLRKSPFKRVWSHKYGLHWNPMPGWRPTRTRVKPLHERVRIHCFAKARRASRTWLADPKETPLPDISAWLAKRYHDPSNPILWSTNDVHLKKVDLETVGARGRGIRKDMQLTPKSHGENEHQHHRVCWWGGAMRLNGVEARLIKKTLGIDKKDMEEWREMNAMHQFFMRGNARDVGSVDEVDLYCIDMEQAKYEARRLGIREQDIIYHPGVISFDVRKQGGPPLAPDNPYGRPMTPAESSAKRRQAKKAALLAQGITPRKRGRPPKVQPEATATA
jgi:hypothetical protein